MLDRVRNISNHGSRSLDSHIVAARRERVGNAVGELLPAHVDERVVQHLAVSVCRRVSKSETLDQPMRWGRRAYRLGAHVRRPWTASFCGMTYE